jgi:hypothetical protein
MTAQREAEATGRLDEALRRMGSDPCIFSLELAVDEIAAELADDADTQDELRSLLRSRLGLHIRA